MLMRVTKKTLAGFGTVDIEASKSFVNEVLSKISGEGKVTNIRDNPGIKGGFLGEKDPWGKFTGIMSELVTILEKQSSKFFIKDQSTFDSAWTYSKFSVNAVIDKKYIKFQITQNISTGKYQGNDGVEDIMIKFDALPKTESQSIVGKVLSKLSSKFESESLLKYESIQESDDELFIWDNGKKRKVVKKDWKKMTMKQFLDQIMDETELDKDQLTISEPTPSSTYVYFEKDLLGIYDDEGGSALISTAE